mgnify:CR=1 FL=1
MIKVLELFGGIGACSKALERLGVEYEIADYVEIDKYAVKSYNAIHNTNFKPQDITTWDKDIEVDLIMHGSPCQDFSIAGKQAGGDKDSGTRSSLMYETIRIVEKLNPKYVIWENVRNLLSKKHIHNFNAYLKTMERLGYTNYYQVLNAKDYGIPQNRERVFTVSIRNDINVNFTFPEKIPLTLTVDDMLDEGVDDCYYRVCNSMIKALHNGKVKDITHAEYTPTITTKQARWNNGGLIRVSCPYVDKKYETFINIHGYIPNKYNPYNDREITDIAPTQTTGCGNVGRSSQVCIKQGYMYRYLTPKECWRLMGFDDSDFEKAAKVNPKGQLYKQAGNSIVVNVLEEILKNLLER